MKIRVFIPMLMLLTGCQGYKIENGRWSLIRYNEGVGRMVTVLKDADQDSFTPINREYAKDKRHVYWQTQVIPGADPSTFACLGHLYSKDKSKVFWREREIKGADPSSFQIVDGGHLLSKDTRDFYFAATPLFVLDLPSFKVINDGWKKDAKAYYTTPNFSKAGRVDCDYLTMKILSNQYAVDRNRAYYYGSPMDGVDVKTFRVTGQIQARDQHKKYRGDKEDWVK
jgi:hypothetical protein